MRNTILNLLAVSLILLSSCTDETDDKKSLSCRLDSYNRSLNYFQYKYNTAGKVSELTTSYNTITNVQYSYKISHTSQTVEISNAYVGGGISPNYSISKIYKLNQDGMPSEATLADGRTAVKYIYAGGRLSYSVERILIESNLTNQDSVVVGYDSGGKNITSLKHHKWSSGKWVYTYEEKFLYDNKINPFRNLFGQENDDIYIPIFFSTNNYTSDGNWTYSYSYNENGYPDRCTFGTKGDVMTFQYTCQ